MGAAGGAVRMLPGAEAGSGGEGPGTPPGPSRGFRQAGRSPQPACAGSLAAFASPSLTAASRTAPATAPETFSLKTLGMM